MLTPLDFLNDLTNPHLAFLPKALFVAVLSALLCGVVGSFVVLRGMAFIGDAVAHAVFPGLAIAFVTGGSLFLGGATAGITVALVIALFASRQRIAHDSVIGIFFAAAFAAGLIILARTPTYSANVTSFLFGSMTGVSTADIITVAAVLLGTLAVLLATGRMLIATSLDRETARSMGVPVLAIDIVLYVVVALTVVVSVRTVGNILVLALLITPAATARLVTRTLIPMMVTSASIGAASALVGVYLSWAADLPTGATIVLITTACFITAWMIQPIAHQLRRRTTTATPQPTGETAPPPTAHPHHRTPAATGHRLPTPPAHPTVHTHQPQG